MNQIVDQFSKLNFQQRVILLGFLMIVIGLVYYFLGYQPKLEELAKLEKTEASLTEKLMENRSIAKNIERFKEEVSVLDEELKQAISLLPNDRDIRSLLRQLSNLQKKTNVTSMLFKPQNEVRKGFYSEIPIELRLEGNYHDIAQFFDKVGKLDRIVNISEIVLTSPKIVDGKMMLTVNCRATTFMFTGGAGLPAPSKSRG